MPKFEVELKRVVDDSYEIEIGHGLVDQVAADLKHGLAGKVHKFAIITDSNVEPLYARPLEQKLAEEGFQTDVFIFPAGKRARRGRQRRCWRMQCWKKVIAETAAFWLLAVA